MKVSCPSCTAKYSIADEKVRNRLAKIRCRKCGTTIVIDGKTDPPTIQAADAAVGRPDEYTVDISDSDQRQMTVDQIVLAYNDGVITAETFVWKEGMGDWETLASVTELNDALHRAAALAAQPPQTAGGADYAAPSHAGAAYAAPTYAAPGAIESPFAASSYGAVSATPPSHPPHAMPTAGSPLTGGLFSGGMASSRAATRTGVGGDLFGGIDHIGGETDLATSASDVLPAQPNTGARNESSVLFSLSALTAGGTVSVKPKPQASSEDSGLIDLAALAAQAGKSTSREANSVSAMPVPLTAPLGAPLIGGSTSPLGDGSAHSVPNRNGLYIGGGIAVAAMVLGGVFLLREPPPPALQPIAIPTALPSAPIEVAAPAADEEDQAEGEKADAEKADGEEEAEADDKDTAKKVATTTRKTYPRTQKSTSKSTSSSKTTSSTSAKSGTEKSSATTTKKAPAKKKNNCNCKPGDLMCAMKCSAK